MNKPFVLIYSPGGLVPQDNELPRFGSLLEAINEGRLRCYDSSYDMAVVLELSDDGDVRVVYEFGEGDNCEETEEV